MLYKDPKDVKYKVNIIDGANDTLVFDFWADCGKHGTDESLAEFTFTPKQLLDVFNMYENEMNNEKS